MTVVLKETQDFEIEISGGSGALVYIYFLIQIEEHLNGAKYSLP